MAATADTTAAATAGLEAAHNEAGTSLVELFLIGRSVAREHADGKIPADELEARVLEGIVALRTAYRKSAALGLFSDNEDVDEISTSSLKYVLIPHYLAYLGQQVFDNEADPVERDAARIAMLTQARASIVLFLEFAEKFGLLHESDKALAAGEQPKDRRTAAIERHRRVKAATEQLDEVMKRKEEVLRTRGAEAVQEYEDDGDDEVEREAILAEIALATAEDANTLSTLDMELDMLRRVQQDREENGGKLPPPAPPATDPLPNITITKRDLLKMQVFNDPNPPLMTLEEYYKLQMEAGNYISGGGAEGEARQAAEAEEKLYTETEADIDAETYRQREWDEFREHNPKGSGNTMANLG